MRIEETFTPVTAMRGRFYGLGSQRDLWDEAWPSLEGLDADSSCS